MDERTDNVLKVFNTAKKFAEEILFPLMENYQQYQIQSDFGSTILTNASFLPEDIRDIERYNGLKAMCDTSLNLAIAVTSTVYLKNNKEEINQLNDTIKNLEKIKHIFYYRRDDFFKKTYKQEQLVDELNIEFFLKIKKIIQTSYINIEILMTRNKLLFSDASDDYKSDSEIMEQIKKEYSGE